MYEFVQICQVYRPGIQTKYGLILSGCRMRKIMLSQQIHARKRKYRVIRSRRTRLGAIFDEAAFPNTCLCKLEKDLKRRQRKFYRPRTMVVNIQIKHQNKPIVGAEGCSKIFAHMMTPSTILLISLPASATRLLWKIHRRRSQISTTICNQLHNSMIRLNNVLEDIEV